VRESALSHPSRQPTRRSFATGAESTRRTALAARLAVAMPRAKMIKQYPVSEFEAPSASQLFVNDSLPFSLEI
jgi:hypothetical protein